MLHPHFPSTLISYLPYCTLFVFFLSLSALLSCGPPWSTSFSSYSSQFQTVVLISSTTVATAQGMTLSFHPHFGVARLLTISISSSSRFGQVCQILPITHGFINPLCCRLNPWKLRGCFKFWTLQIATGSLPWNIAFLQENESPYRSECKLLVSNFRRL